MKLFLKINLWVLLVYHVFLGAEFTVPPLPYAYNALEPYIDELTMRLHHDKHHQSYVDGLNKALEVYPELQEKSIEELVRMWKRLPKDVQTAVRNQGGGHLNHSLFWQWMAPAVVGKPTMPFGNVEQAIKRTFGSFNAFTKKFNEKSKKVFGSGWAWLCLDKRGKLVIVTTTNQDNPMTNDLYPILGLDVWEHAYYLKYKNERATYLNAWWSVVNWAEVERLYNSYVKRLPKSCSR